MPPGYPTGYRSALGLLWLGLGSHTNVVDGQVDCFIVRGGTRATSASNGSRSCSFWVELGIEVRLGQGIRFWSAEGNKRAAMTASWMCF